jgi:hypothetical protein
MGQRQKRQKRQNQHRKNLKSKKRENFKVLENGVKTGAFGALQLLKK